MASKAVRENGKLRGLDYRGHRLKLGMTQTRLAELAKARPSQISRLESGERTPRRPTLARIKRVLGIE